MKKRFPCLYILRCLFVCLLVIMPPPFQTMRPMHFWYDCKTINKVVYTFAVRQFQPKRTKAIEFRVILIFDVCKFMMFTSCFEIGKAYRCRTFPDWGVGLGYHLVLGSFWEWGPCTDTHYASRTRRWNTCTLCWNQWQWQCNASCSLIIWQIMLKSSD
jgi:hypothetical protein